MTIHQLRKRSNTFVANMEYYINEVVEHNEDLINLNRKQLDNSKTSKDGALINSRTGSNKYTPDYARKKGYQYPDLKVTGHFRNEMDIIYTEPKDYFLTSYAAVSKHLMKMYTPNIFGISVKNQKTAQGITTNLLSIKYKRLVL